MPSAKPKSPEDTHDAAVDDNEQPFLDHLGYLIFLSTQEFY